MAYDWDWTIAARYLVAWRSGLFVTLQLTISAIAMGTVLGYPLGILLRATHPAWREVRFLAAGLVDVVRALPALILLLIFNYWVGGLVGINSPFWLAALALSVNLAAFTAEVVRAALDAVPRPLREAGLALGMKPGTVLLHIELPAAARETLPTMALLYIDILKLSSLASIIAVPEIVYIAAQVSAREYRYLEASAILALIYITLVLPFALLARRLERRGWLRRIA